MGIDPSNVQLFYSRIEDLQLEDGPLKSFLDNSKDLEPSERGVKLSENEAIIAAHNEAAADGQSNQVAGEAGHHMICFVGVGGQLYDLDSLSAHPLCVGECGGGDQLQAMALAAAKGYMDRYTHEHGQLWAQDTILGTQMAFSSTFSHLWRKIRKHVPLCN